MWHLSVGRHLPAPRYFVFFFIRETGVFNIGRERERGIQQQDFIYVTLEVLAH